jgi:hypothetical protein
LTKKCEECGCVNKDFASFCYKCGEKIDEKVEHVKSDPDDTSFNAENNENLNNAEKDVKSIMPKFKAWWSERSVKGKGLTVFSACCFGILIIGLIGGMVSPDHTNSTNTSPTNTSTNVTTNDSVSVDTTPQSVTIDQLYSKSVAEGTYVKVTGIALDTDGTYLRLRNSEYRDIYVMGSDLNVYEDQKVTLTGYYDGPFTFTAISGGSRTVPLIRDAKIV